MEKNLFKVKEGISFTITTKSENVEVLKEASKKYQVEIPDAKYIIICTDEQIDYYYELVGYGITKFAFGIPTDSLKDETYALMLLADNIDDMSWDDILESYLAEMGIDYEE